MLKSFIKELLKDRGHAIIRYRIPVPSQQSSDRETVLDIAPYGGAGGTRTLDFLNAIEALSQLSYSPTEIQYTRGPRSAQPAKCEFRADLVRVYPRSSNRNNTRMCLWVQGTPCHQPTRLAAMYAPTPSISKKKTLGKVNTNTSGLTSPATT